jgi:glycosyltransferase involved in cell wall biosynthesis
MVFTMFESDTLPCGLHENIHEFDTVFVPSKQCVELFSVVSPNVVRCPLGVDPEVWPYVERPEIDRYFNIYMPGQGARKGTDVSFKAFQAAFPKAKKLDPEPHLMAKSLGDDGFYDERMEKRIGVISSDEERSFYDAAHVSINLARGEGWGLFPLQAISMGIPTILTDAHGHAEFSHLGLPVSATKVPAGKFLYGDAGMWWEPNLDEAVEWLRDIYENYPVYEDFAWRMSTKCHDEFHYGHSAKAMMDAIGDSDFVDRGEYYKSQSREFLLRVTRYLNPFIGGITYEFEKNHDYWVPADVRRVIKDAGFLEESCLVDQTGRVPGQELLEV